MGRFNFDKIIERRGTSCEKWDGLKELFGQEDLIAMWVADMDFKSPPALIDAFKKRVEHGIFGYTYRTQDYYEAIINWLKKRHNFKIKQQWISHSPGVVTGIVVSILALTSPGDKIIVFSPAYPPFRRSVLENGRQLVLTSLKLLNDKFVMDFDDLKEKIDERTKMLILCSPHNPTGRVWTEKELLTLAEICLKNDLIVISDEIHCDIVFKGNKHIPFASLGDEIAQKTITFMSPSKSFNVAGLINSYAIIPNPKLKISYETLLKAIHLNECNIFGMEALKVLYNECEDWLNELILYLQENITFVDNYFKTEIPALRLIIPQGTYIPLVDCRKLNMTDNQLKDFFINKAKVAVNMGSIYGKETEGFIRLNIATPRKLLEKGLNQIKKALL